MTNSPAVKLPEVATIEFHGTQLITIKKDELEFVAMKPVVEGIGLAWQKQHEKLNRDKDKFSYHLMVTTGKDGKRYEMSCLPITKLNGWLFSINPNKIPNIDVRKRVVEYQEECFIALYDYWHKGKAERKIELPETITPSEQHEITVAVKSKAGVNGKAIPEIWSRVHNKFKIAKYSQLTRDKFYDALHYIYGMEIKAQQIIPAVPAPQIELERLSAKVAFLEEVNEFLRDSNKTYLSLYRELLSITIEFYKPKSPAKTLKPNPV